MEKALLDGDVVYADWAAEHPDSLSGKRLKCYGCAADAFLNTGSWRQAPYFASKGHADGCKAAHQGENWSDSKLVQADTVIIPIGFGHSSSDNADAPSKRSQSSQRIAISGSSGTTEMSARRGVRAVLRELLVRPGFSTSNKRIVVGDTDAPAREFFVPFLELGDEHVGRLIGVWGTLFSARERGSVAWLNRGDQKVDIRIPIAIFNELKTIYKFNSAMELEDANFLLVGSFNLHLEFRVTDVKQIALQVKGGS